MKKKRIVMAFSDGPKADPVENAMAYWAMRFYSKLRGYHRIALSHPTRTHLRKSLSRHDDIWLVAFWGHGRQQDGAFLDHTSSPAVLPVDVKLLGDKVFFGMYCWSNKLLKKARSGQTRRTFKSFLGFDHEVWLMFHPEGEAVAGFEKVAEETLDVLINGDGAEQAATTYRLASARWYNHWMCHQALMGKEQRYSDQVDALLTAFAFVNNMSIIQGYDDP